MNRNLLTIFGILLLCALVVALIMFSSKPEKETSNIAENTSSQPPKAAAPQIGNSIFSTIDSVVLL